MHKTEILDNGNVKIIIPIALRQRGARRRLEIGTDPFAISTEPLKIQLARAFRWQELIDKREFSNIKELAKALKLDPSYIAKTIRLTMLSPAMVHAILTDATPDNINVSALRTNIPIDWNTQKEWFARLGNQNESIS